ncbi:Heat repeat protein [Phytophthora palmivora]|uniref:Heat repeat protein n=1 Tax=Phytophthora palmivora TaxID=4796 RepID=A0A2P4XG25_9STRA|nr:Heat repeat protein [Phytophthora palmivora]
MKMKVHSGLQLQVLSLYKKALQAAKRKDQETLRYVRERFREDVRGFDRKDFVVIEYMLRKGERDLKMLDKMKSAHFANVSHHK